MKKLLLIIISSLVAVIGVYLYMAHRTVSSVRPAANSSSPMAKNVQSSGNQSLTDRANLRPSSNRVVGNKLPDYVINHLSLTDKEIGDMTKIFNELRFNSLRTVAKYATCEYSENSTVGIVLETPKVVVDDLSNKTLQAIENYLGNSRYEAIITDELKDVMLGDIHYYAKRNGMLIVTIDGADSDQIRTIRVNQNITRDDGYSSGSIVVFTQKPAEQFNNIFGAVADMVFLNWKPLKK